MPGSKTVISRYKVKCPICGRRYDHPESNEPDGISDSVLIDCDCGIRFESIAIIKDEFTSVVSFENTYYGVIE